MVPSDEAESQGVDVVALSIVHPVDDPALPIELARIRRGVPSHVPVLERLRAV
ncbi:MAG: hypothetical protein MJB57_15925 [Gemmatimonadetes bacterium]|nr:hypothetical protein [Gemmatimonadota bacterium]